MILGLDIGPNSIGWALVDAREAGSQIIDLGVRVFPEGVANFETSKEISRNEARRIARGMRRQIQRRRRRRANLRAALTTAGLLPSDPDELRRVLAIDPYSLRRRALTETLQPFEIGRIFVHLNQRRGFLSNARRDRGDKEVKGMLQEINELGAAMGARTLGQHLAELHDNPHLRVRGRHTRRQMLRDEFDGIWKAQSAHHPRLLTDALRYGAAGPQIQPHRPRRLPHGTDRVTQYGVEGIIFFQRPLYWPKSMIGPCEVEPREPRCPRADRAAQRFRVLQEANNLRIVDPDRHEERPLSADERSLLLERLSKKERLSFDEIRRQLGFLESVRFNLERGERSSIGGMKTDVLLAKSFKGWPELPEPRKDAVVRLLLDPALDEQIARDSLVRDHGFDAKTADGLVAVDLPSGYANLSLKAIAKLLPFLERGMPYMGTSDPAASALHAAGYLRRDELARRLFDSLPPLDRVRSGPLAQLPNPVVAAALYQVRKVVNAVLREYGRPDAIHVELARELKMGRAKRQEYNSRIREREEERAAAADYLRENQVTPRRDNVTKYLLWKQQREICIYTGSPIRFEHLFGGEIDIDHILPYSNSLDDSQANKVVCFHAANSEKGQQTPYKWLGETQPERYEQLCHRARHLPYPKYRKFVQRELELEDFIARQLRDTAYIARLTLEYLKMLVKEEHQVLGLKGQHTAELRHHWGLDTVLSELPDSPAWVEDREGTERPGGKNRADHRHHAIDAVVVALTNRSRLQHLARIRRDGGVQAKAEILAPPWPAFRQELQAKVAGIRVSHRTERSVHGALHEDTLYGPTPQPGVYVVRKPLENLSTSEVERIRDPAVRRKVEARLRERGVDPGRGKAAIPKGVWDKPLWMSEEKAIAIRRVRLTKPEESVVPIRGPDTRAFVKPGRLHHVALFKMQSNGKVRYVSRYVSMLEASVRKTDRRAVIERQHSDNPDAKFVMSLSSGDSVLVRREGADRLMVVSALVSTQRRVHLIDANDARPASGDAKRKDIGLTPGSLLGKYGARKVTVDPLGRIRWAND